LALEHFHRALALFSKFDVRDDFAAAAIEGAARVALARAQAIEGVELLGGTAAWRDFTGIKGALVERRTLDREREAARQSLGDDVFRIHWRIGETRSFDEAIAGALSVTANARIQPQVDKQGVPADLRRLSPREREILCLVAQGRRDREIADELGIADRTVT